MEILLSRTCLAYESELADKNQLYPLNPFHNRQLYIAHDWLGMTRIKRTHVGINRRRPVKYSERNS